MKRLSILLFFLIFAQATWAGDIVKLTNDKTFQGDVKRIRDCQVVFKAEGQRFRIPAQDILFIKFEDPDDKILKRYQEMNDPDKCLKGRRDADLYHGKTGAHFALGALFGPFAVIGAAIANPEPQDGKETLQLSKNDKMFDDPAYLQCYKKKAKKKNAGTAALGWLSWVAILLII